MAAARPIERVAEMFDASHHTPNLHADFHTAMYGILIFKETTNVKQVAHDRLRFNSASDRRLMAKYQQMEKSIDDIKRLKAISPENSVIMDKILKLIDDQNRNETMQSLSKYDNVLKFAANFYPKAIKQFFDISFLKLEKIIHKNPLANHTLQRTYRPKLDHFFGIDIKVPIKYQVARLRDVEKPQEIPHVLQGEIAGLNKIFQISLDPTRINETIRLMCHLEDDRLPVVPPIYIDIPEKYPFCSPTCVIMQHDYSVTPFLFNVQNILTDIIFKLPKCYSVTHILSSWEMSIRKSCYLKSFNDDNFSMIYDMLMQ